MTNGKNNKFVEGSYKRGVNNHHRLLYAEAIPEIAYIRMKTSGKCFVYDNRIIYNGQKPIAEIDDKKMPSYRLKKDEKFLFTGSLKDCLLYARDHLLETYDRDRLRRCNLQAHIKR